MIRSRAQTIAVAYDKLAQANHYMLGIAEPLAMDELEEARQILISNQNTMPHSRRYKIIDRALDLIELDIKAKLQ